MLIKAAAETNVIMYLMIAVGVLGVVAKTVNHITLSKLVKAAGNMPKSTNKLIKLVRAKYEHACMIHGTVGNVDSFVEKYIYEYRGFLFRIHTWRQIELMSVWGSGVLAAAGALAVYLFYGLNEFVYQYIASGAAEMVLLSVLIRMTDEPYKINALKMYMTDYLENICAFRLKRMRSSERDTIDVITRENSFSSRTGTVDHAVAGNAREPEKEDRYPSESFSRMDSSQSDGQSGSLSSERSGSMPSGQSDSLNSGRSGSMPSGQPDDLSSGRSDNSSLGWSENLSSEQDLPINIEGEPRIVQSYERGRYDNGNEYRYEEQQRAANEHRQRSRGRKMAGDYQQDVDDPRMKRYTENNQKNMDDGRAWQEKPSYRQRRDYQEEGENRQNLKEETIRQILEEFLA